jgi:hypothetical protein
MLMTVSSLPKFNLVLFLVNRSPFRNAVDQLLCLFQADKQGPFQPSEALPKVINSPFYHLSSPYLAVPILVLSFWTLTSMDHMKLQAVIPLAIALGLLVSAVLLRTRDLAMPLWMGRQFMKWAGVSILIMIFVGYA